ncbi:cyclin-dependent kinase inhibitor 1B-like [Lates japonicus]
MCNKMSDVRLSNASPTLERVDARQQDNRRPSVCRNLFGTPDREGLQRNAEAHRQEELQAFRERYNFDPETDRPLSSGNYAWEEDSNPPEFYLRPPHGSQRPQRDADSPGDNNTRRDAEERSGRRPNHQPDREGSRKRRPGPPGPCSGECQNKKPHTDGDDDEDQSDRGAGSQAVKAAEERPNRPENGAEVQ